MMESDACEEPQLKLSPGVFSFFFEKREVEAGEMACWLDHILILLRAKVCFPAPISDGSQTPITVAPGNPILSSGPCGYPDLYA